MDIETKVCTSCNSEKDIEEFAHKRNKRQSTCKDCFKRYAKAHYKSNKDYYKSKARKFTKSKKPMLLQFVIDYLKEHPCVDCGEDDPIVLEFDHVRGIKHKAISRMVQTCCSEELISEEIAKCEVRCANCHRRRTAIQFDHYKGISL